MNVDPRAIQPTADRLLDHEAVMARLQQLEDRETIHLETIGHSRQGRPLPAIVVTDPGASRPVAGRPRADHPSISANQFTWDGPVGEEARIPVLFLASNYGNEAAQTAALIELADQLSDPVSERTRAVLERLVVILVPMLNPDGYERALRTWRRSPRAAATRAYGNAYGVQVAREYLHLLEPETRALADLVRRWHPYLVWEIHEDAINLGRTNPHTCLSPPLAPRDEVGLAVLGLPGENHPLLTDQERRYGAAIADAWRRGGHDVLHHPEGRHGWLQPVDPRYAHVAQHPETRFTRAMALRGVTTFITESSRYPGSQTWQDRVDQKVQAGWAILELARDDQDLVQIAFEVATAASDGDNGFYLLPDDQDPSTLAAAIELLTRHEIRLYRPRPADPRPSSVSGVVVPRAQPLRSTVDLLLDVETGRHQSLTATIGLRVLASAALPDPVRARIADAGLCGLELDPSISPRPLTSPSSAASAAIQVYAGQGVADYAAEGYLGGVLRALDLAGVSYRRVGAVDVRDGCLAEADVLLVPNGDASVIMHGNPPDSLWHGPPWEAEEPSRGLGPEGADAVRSFVAEGGRYIGIDAGGALLATSAYLAISDVEVVARNLGTGLVELTVHDPADPIFEGLGGSFGPRGEWRPHRLYAMLCSNPSLGEPGAHVFGTEPEADAEVLASFATFLPVAGATHLPDRPPGTRPADRAAIVRTPFGAGSVLLFAIEPTYRALSPRTARLLTNAVQPADRKRPAPGRDEPTDRADITTRAGSRHMTRTVDPTDLARGTRTLDLRDGMRLYTRWVGGEAGARSTLLCIHGGPGAVAHDGLAPLEGIASPDRRVIFYDQLGVGRSTPPPDADQWGFTLAFEEIAAIRAAYDLAEVSVLGHSYGGYIAQEYALTRPDGLRALVLADTAADVDSYLAEGRRFRENLPPDVRAVLDQHERAGTITSDEYTAAYDVFLSRFLCKLEPVPEPIWEGRRRGNPEMTRLLWGEAGFAFNLTGRLAGWSVRDRLPEIVVPTLVITGSDDMASPALAADMVDGLPHARFVVIDGGSHTPFYEAPDRFCGAVTSFLDEVGA